MIMKSYLKFLRSLQSGLNCLLTTSGSGGMSSRLSEKRGCISVIKLLQFTLVRSLWASLGKALF